MNILHISLVLRILENVPLGFDSLVVTDLFKHGSINKINHVVRFYSVNGTDGFSSV
jgi:hypothetical protein